MVVYFGVTANKVNKAKYRKEIFPPHKNSTSENLQFNRLFVNCGQTKTEA